MFASPALCHFRKTRTQCLSGRTENNHGTLVGIVGFRAGMKHKTDRIHVCTHTVRPLAYHIIICATEFFLVLPLQARSHTTHSPPRLIPNVRFFLQSHPLRLQRLSTLPGQLEYYDVAWGLTNVLLRGVCGQHIKTSLPSGSAQFERQRDIQRYQNSPMASRTFCS
jgi:hypothetical protein